MHIALALLVALTQDDLQSKLCRAFESEKFDPTLIADAKASPNFGTRYIAALVQIKASLATGRGHEGAYQKIVTLGGPAGAAEHLRALAASYKAAVYCRDCSNGKVVCGQCNGKKRTEVKCLVCEGKGRVGAPGAVDKAAVTMKCRNCDGKQVFRDVRCPGCAGTGAVDCPSCLGSPWHDRACTVKECRNGRVPCPQCKGKGKVEVTCPTCQGRGRVNAPGGVNPGEVTQRCNDCDSRGVLKDKAPCPACDNTAIGIGWTRCDVCRGDGHKDAIAASVVFETESCAPCAKCLGLGFRIKPASAPTKILD
jgi:DnaJ-class molecular chaperone